MGTHGCNGCIDLDNPGNLVLNSTFRLVPRLQRIFVGSWLTTADFIALLGTEAAKAGAKNAGKLS